MSIGAKPTLGRAKKSNAMPGPGPVRLGLWRLVSWTASSLYAHRRDANLWLLLVILLELAAIAVLWRLIQSL